MRGEWHECYVYRIVSERNWRRPASDIECNSYSAIERFPISIKVFRISNYVYIRHVRCHVHSFEIYSCIVLLDKQPKKQHFSPEARPSRKHSEKYTNHWNEILLLLLKNRIDCTAPQWRHVVTVGKKRKIIVIAESQQPFECYAIQNAFFSVIMSHSKNAYPIDVDSDKFRNIPDLSCVMGNVR